MQTWDWPCLHQIFNQSFGCSLLQSQFRAFKWIHPIDLKDLDDNEVECADLDGDGRMDLVIASLSGEERVLRNTGAAFEPLVDDFPAQGDSTLGIHVEGARIDIIPLIDIIFFLLATFIMVSLSMSKNSPRDRWKLQLAVNSNPPGASSFIACRLMSL